MSSSKSTKEGFQPTAHKIPLGKSCLASMGLQGINCGSGKTLHPGLLNTDILQLGDMHGNQTSPGRAYSYNGNLYYLQHDQTQPLPLESECCTYVFSEHFIEHIKPEQGISWLQEVHRILKPGGLARISTPDLALYIDGYADPTHSFYKLHKTQLEKMGLKSCSERPGWMINQIFRYYGHQWLYDQEEFTFAAALAGFDIKLATKCSFRSGSSPIIASLDQEIRSDESLYMELIKS